MKPVKRIKDILKSTAPEDSLLVRGWVRTRRDAKDFSFIELGDGSSVANLQLILPKGIIEADTFKDINTGTALEVEGELAPSQGKGQKWELLVKEIRVLGPAGPDYPLQKKRHTDEYLREIAHLRPRTNKYGALLRIRSEAAFAIHTFFRERGFYYVHTPIITGNDCEGAGELFQLITPGPGAACGLHPQAPLKTLAEDFFGKPASLTVSGQLEAEILAHGLTAVYTFGPTFRAENSNTPRHAAEFWMIEPEAAFMDLSGDMDLAEDMVKSVLTQITSACTEDLELFDKFVSEGLLLRLEELKKKDYTRISYKEAIEILSSAEASFDFMPLYGSDLQTEHERYLTETHFQGPVFVYDYPKTIKPFYMRINDDNQTVAAMDLLVPRVGELIGGSQREERYDVLVSRMKELGLKPENYWWYLDLRRWGGTPHAGFGLGFERLLMLVTGIGNIRDVIPFPRTPGNLEF